MMNEDRMGRGRVLLADDEEAVRRPLRLALESVGFQVQEVASGFDAARALDEGVCDVALVDINMPGNQRLEFIKQRPDERRSVPIVIITGYPSFETAVDALRLGVVDYVIKPVNPEVLFVRLDEAIQKGKLLALIDEADRRAAQLSTWLGSLRSALQSGGRLADVPSGTWPTFVEARGGRVPSDPPSGTSVRVQSSADPLWALSAEERGRLSPRECEVIDELARGRRVREAACALGLSTNTVRNHLKSIFVKLGVSSQVQLLGRLAGHR
jgi:DNA-binding NarL/FixJ family response regulator